MLHLKTLMGNHPHALPLERGDVRSSRIALDFAHEPVPVEACKPFVCDLKFDCGELAIATFLQAMVYGKTLVVLPAVIGARFHHASIGYNVSPGVLAPKDLERRTVAVPTYAQTTRVWVRGVLQHDYGVDPSRVNFLTFDEAHLAEYCDPRNSRSIERNQNPSRKRHGARRRPMKLPSLHFRHLTECAAFGPMNVA